ncbi:hypothetical protein OG230_00385 [Streptomyces sp. NBC_00234]|uniref:hypothetical protein n=1 Tax=Streptomyces sp. NBC_00234 TaxID=2903638 RepID=UPI002E2BB464|nr:hypothetical protein [Streptomyces sp. NBC_00234]
MLGAAKGVEGTLLPAVRDPHADAVAALSPTSVVRANVAPASTGRRTSSFGATPVQQAVRSIIRETGDMIDTPA